MRLMSEYLENARIHETADNVEIRWEYEEKTYGLIIPQEMLDLLCLDGGLDTPVLTKIMRFVRLGDDTEMNVEVQL